MSQPYGHPCEAEGCDALTRPEELMCRHHWFMVPAPLQKKVIQTWRQARETGNFKLHFHKQFTRFDSHSEREIQ